MSHPAHVAAPVIYDVLVIGGGPAGSAAALAARERGLEVCLLETGRPPFSKVCGEFLSEPGMAMFERLTGVSRSRFPKIRTVCFLNHSSGSASLPRQETSGGERNGSAALTLRLDPGGHGVSRATLDGMLLAAASKSGADVHLGTRVVRARREGDGWRVIAREGSPEGRHSTFEARQLVAATGRAATTSRFRGSWSGRRMVARSGPRLADLEIQFTDGGYRGLSAVDGGGVNLCGVERRKDNTAYRRHEQVLEPVGHTGHRPVCASRPGRTGIMRGTPYYRIGYQNPRWPGSFAVGDAFAAWPPLVGDGITMALHTGLELGTRLSDPLFNAEEWGRVWRSRYGRALSRSLMLHAVVANELMRGSLMRAGAFSRGFAEWLIRQPRFTTEAT